VNCLLYLPNFVWLMNAPCGPQFRPAHAAPPARPFRGFHDLWTTIAVIAKNKHLLWMTLLAGGASFFVSNSYQAQMPAYAHDLGHGDPSMTYSLLLAADAIGALCAGLLWEYWGAKSQPTSQKAVLFSWIWAVSLCAFALSDNYVFSMGVLFFAGFAEMRGRVMGLFNMSSLGLRFGSGLCVGLLGGLVGSHWALFAACVMFLIFLAALNRSLGRRSDV
jgi:MFS family permease